MSDQAMRRTDELLTELVELMETARTLPMSSSAVVPREHVLDLLDALRETMPPEMGEARRVLATRDDVLRGAHEQAEMDLASAHEQATQIVSAARAEHERLVDATTVLQDARIRADELVETTRIEMADYAARVRADVDAYAAKLGRDAEDYADSTLAELAQTLTRAAAVAEQGRVALARRRDDGGPQISG